MRVESASRAGEAGRGIVDLMASGQRGKRHGVHGAPRAPPPPASRAPADPEIPAEYPARRPNRPCMAEDAGGRRSFANHARHGRAHDPGFLAADRLAIVSEPRPVVDVDRGDQRHARLERVDRIQPAAETHLHDRDVDPRPLDDVRRGQGSELEERERGLPARGVDPLEGLDEGRIGYLVPSDPHPFVVPDKMRRAVGCGAQSGRGQHRFEKGHARALSVRARDQDARERRGAEAQRVAYPSAAFQTQIDCARVQRGLPVEPVAQRASSYRSHRTLRPRAPHRPIERRRPRDQGVGWWVSIASRPAMVSRCSRRSTIMSTAPCRSRNSLR